MRLLLGSVLAAMTCQLALAQPVQIMAWNVENLYDIEDDESNPHDNTYLPLATKQAAGQAHDDLCVLNNPNPGFFQDQCRELDWNSQVYQTKLERISGVLKSMGTLPEVLILSETENARVIGDLVAELGQASYPTIVALDTSDEPISRGIDVAMASKYPLVGEPTAHKIDFKSDVDVCGATRDILEATFALDNGEQLTVLGVHFPSQGNPPECRIRAFQQMSAIRDSKGDSALVIAGGDFNFDCSELASPMYTRLVQRGGWYLSSIISAGCNAPGSSKFYDRLMSWNTWSYLDQLLISGGLSVTQASDLNWFADLGSFQTVVLHPEQIMTDEDDEGFVEPRRFDPELGTGISDHWPVMMRLLNRRAE